MKPLIFIFTALAALYSGAVAAAANVTESVTTLSAPAEYCFPLGLVGVGGQDRTILYNLVVRAEDVGKQGDVFVKFSDGSSTADWWMQPKATLAGYVSYTQPSTSSWVNVSSASTPPAFSSGALQPITFIDIALNPVNLLSTAGNGTLYVGYGLRTGSASSLNESFSEMLTHSRLVRVWRVNDQTLSSTSAPNLNTPLYEPGDPMCVTITQIKRIIRGFSPE